VLQGRIREDAGPLKVEDDNQLDEVLRTATEEARKSGTLGAILIEAANGNVITMVVAGDETVLGFDYGHHDPPNYSSRQDGQPVPTNWSSQTALTISFFSP